MPGVELLEEFDGLQLFRVDGKASYFLEGQGKIAERGHN